MTPDVMVDDELLSKGWENGGKDWRLGVYGAWMNKAQALSAQTAIDSARKEARREALEEAAAARLENDPILKMIVRRMGLFARREALEEAAGICRAICEEQFEAASKAPMDVVKVIHTANATAADRCEKDIRAAMEKEASDPCPSTCPKCYPKAMENDA